MLSLSYGERKEEDALPRVVFRAVIYSIMKCDLGNCKLSDFILKHNEISINFSAERAMCSSGSLHKRLRSKQQLRLLEAAAPRPAQALPLG